MPVQFIVKKNINGWLFTVYFFRGWYIVGIHAANGKPYYWQFVTEQEAVKFYSFMCSGFTAFHSKTTLNQKQISLF